MQKNSAGLLMYRIKKGKPEILLVHPGGPFYARKDDGVWSVPKGEADNGENGEELLNVARREFQEETGFTISEPLVSLGCAKREDGKTVHAWAFEGDCDPTQLKSNTILIDWPPRTGKKMEIPEVDKAAFFSLEEAKKKMYSYQTPIIETFEKFIKI